MSALDVLLVMFELAEPAEQDEVLTALGVPLSAADEHDPESVGKVHRYRDDTLLEALRRCGRELGVPPTVAAYEHWRISKPERLPSSSPFMRFGGWRRALARAGFSADAIAAHLDEGRERSRESLRRTGVRYARPSNHQRCSRETGETSSRPSSTAASEPTAAKLT
jgi:hypothetical protein